MINYKELLVHSGYSVIDTMKQLDSTALGILFVIEDERLVGSITDGDIRRWIISNGALDVEIKNVANYSPKFITNNTMDEAFELMEKYVINAIPVVDEENKVVDIIFRQDYLGLTFDERIKLDVCVVVMAGGKGTRLYPYTKVLPKALIPIGEIPIVERIMNRFNSYGIDEFYMVVNHKKEMIKAYFSEDNLNYDICFVDEEKPLGTGGGVKLIDGKIHKTFILSNCDILIMENFSKIIDEHRKQKNIITMIVSAKKYVIPYGVVEMDDSGQVSSLREKPTMSFLTNTGTYIVEPAVMNLVNYNERIDFPDVIERCKSNGMKVGIYPITEDAWYDMGQIEEMKRMEAMFVE